MCSRDDLPKSLWWCEYVFCVVAEVKTVEPVSEFPAGWRPATLYKLHSDPSSFCLFFGDEEYEGLDVHYTFVDGVLRDGDGDVVELVDRVQQVTDVQEAPAPVPDKELVDPELDELEKNGGGYLSDSDNDFLFGDDDGDKKIVKL